MYGACSIDILLRHKINNVAATQARFALNRIEFPENTYTKTKSLPGLLIVFQGTTT